MTLRQVDTKIVAESGLSIVRIIEREVGCADDLDACMPHHGIAKSLVFTAGIQKAQQGLLNSRSMSPISSRNSVPSLACSTMPPTTSLFAPVKGTSPNNCAYKVPL